MLLSRGVAGLDSDTPSESLPQAPLIAILENASIHILSLGPSSPSEVTYTPAQPLLLPVLFYHIYCFPATTQFH